MLDAVGFRFEPHTLSAIAKTRNQRLSTFQNEK